MKRIRFRKEEDGVMYLITNWKTIKGKVVFSTGKCWKFPMKKKKRAA